MTRPARVLVRGVDVDGQPFELAAEGCFARCLQHETDHLLGRLYTDLLTDPVRRRVHAASAEARDAARERRAARATALGKRPAATSASSLHLGDAVRRP